MKKRRVKFYMFNEKTRELLSIETIDTMPVSDDEFQKFLEEQISRRECFCYEICV